MRYTLALVAVVAVMLVVVGPAGTAFGATFTVNSTGDGADASTADGMCADAGGQCTLRAAIQQANASAGKDTIGFSIGSGPKTITPGSELPAVFGAVTIDGTTQPGFAGKPIIELDGSNTEQDAAGLYLISGGSTVRGLVINRFTGDGIGISFGATTIVGNYIGTDLAGTAAKANFIGIGLYGPMGSTIGGTTVADRNVISGNQTGIWFSGVNGNTISGNYIGTDATGAADLGNTGGGLHVQGDGNVIGGAAPGAGNVISGTDIDPGIYVSNGSGNVIQGNRIGTNAAGTAALPNVGGGITIFPVDGTDNVIGGSGWARNIISGNLGTGVWIGAGTGTTVKGNFIGTDVTGTVAIGNSEWGVVVEGEGSNVVGGTSVAERNVISGNGSDGISMSQTAANLVQGNFIGTDVSGTAAVPNGGHGVLSGRGEGNQIGGELAGAGNLIAFNGGDGVRTNEAGVALIGDTIHGNSIHSNVGLGIDNTNGGNGEIAAPVITGVGPVQGTSLADCAIDVYSDDVDEGGIYYGTVAADALGAWTYPGLVGGPNVTATCTDAAGNTSEFSAPFASPCALDDTDCDAVADATDNCVHYANTGQDDSNGDGVGDACAPPSPDVDCNGAMNSVDALKVLRSSAGLAIQQTQPCSALGDMLPPGKLMGDVNCNGVVNSVDALLVLRMNAALAVVLPVECPVPPA